MGYVLLGSIIWRLLIEVIIGKYQLFLGSAAAQQANNTS